MKEQFKKIRELPDDLENTDNLQESDSIKVNVDFPELPKIVKDVANPVR